MRRSRISATDNRAWSCSLRFGRLALGAVTLVTIGAFGVTQALANGSVGFAFGFPIYLGPPAVYGPPAYAAPPPPVYYYPEPAGAPEGAAAPSSVVTPAGGTTYSTQTCREYQTTTTIEGVARQSSGTACLQPDGTWRLMN